MARSGGFAGSRGKPRMRDLEMSREQGTSENQDAAPEPVPQLEPQAQERLYKPLIEKIFFANYTKGNREVVWERREIQTAAQQLGIRLPKNLGDVVYNMRYRADLPESVQAAAPKGMTWVILPAGRSRYRFVPARSAYFSPNPKWADTKIPDATPGVIAMYAFTDEQSLLAKLRYNRLIDIFASEAAGVAKAAQSRRDAVLQQHMRRGVRHGRREQPSSRPAATE